MSDIKIKVLGPGCKNCEKLYENTRSAVGRMELDADVEYIKDMEEIKKYIMMTPGLVIDNKIVHQGKPLPNPEKIEKLIRKVIGK